MARKGPPITRRKPDQLRKSISLRVRLTAEQDREIRKAAERTGISLSAWVVERLLAAARKEAGGPGA